MNKVSRLEQDRYLTVDGARFHTIWLRDNCPCIGCRDPRNFQKLFDFTTLDEPPRVGRSQLGETTLEIVWQDGHTSIYDREWLAAHAYDLPGFSKAHSAVERRRSDQVLWDAASVKSLAPAKHDIAKVPQSAWTDEIARLGFTVVTGVSDLKSLIRRIGPIHPFETGLTYDVGIKPADFGLSQTHHPLLPHNDYEGFLHTANLLQFLHCVKNEAQGGDSILVDGFKVAEDLRREAPEDFELLSTQNVQFEKFDTGSALFNRRTRTVIVTDPQGEIVEVSFNNSHAWQWDVPFDRMEAYYAAYGRWFRMLKDEKYHHRFRLEPGDCYIVQGPRVLHSRTGSVPGSGIRHMVTAFCEFDYVLGRQNYLSQKHLFLDEGDERGDLARIEKIRFED